MVEKKPTIRQHSWPGARSRAGFALGLRRGTQALAAAALLLIFSAATASAQFDPEDVVAFLSLEAYVGQPALVVEFGHEQPALDRLGAVLVDETHYVSPHLGGNLLFEMHPVPHLPPMVDPGDPDLSVLVYRNRACTLVPDTPVTCTQVTEPDDPLFGYWKLAWDPAKNRCTTVVAGEYCLEFLTIGWYYEFFYDENCSLEVPNTRIEIPAHYCIP
ncbi:MAG: hypothetical protein K0U98_08335 [Deltaproteobacteria bacterium]|nr:hypothetical protein [Deltaproteobacteria bacterium]